MVRKPAPAPESRCDQSWDWPALDVPMAYTVGGASASAAVASEDRRRDRRQKKKRAHTLFGLVFQGARPDVAELRTRVHVAHPRATSVTGKD